jgi:hypothetical protein
VAGNEYVDVPVTDHGIPRASIEVSSPATIDCPPRYASPEIRIHQGAVQIRFYCKWPGVPVLVRMKNEVAYLIARFDGGERAVEAVFTVPTKDGLRADQEGGPGRSRHPAAERGQQQGIARLPAPAAGLALEDAKLMAEKQYLRLEAGLGAAADEEGGAGGTSCRAGPGA